MENIRFGKPNATDVEVIEAAKLAMADDFIRLFPDGYQTIVGERGVTVSGLLRFRYFALLFVLF
jgi:ATP-binding cassette subfamily B (MDR/TAP) protein 8